MKTRPNSIIYVRRKPLTSEAPNIYNFRTQDRMFYFDLLSLFQKDAKFSLEPIEFNPPGVLKRKLGFSTVVGQLLVFQPVKRLLKNGVNFYKFRKHAKFHLLEKPLGDTNVLFLDAGTRSIDRVITEFIGQGAAVFLKEQNTIRQVDSLMERKVWDQNIDVRSDSYLQIKTQCEKAFQELENSNVINWINDKCVLDVRSIVLPYFKSFLLEDISRILNLLEQFVSFFEQRKIHFVIARTSTGENYPEALLAAQISGIKRVCFQHGVDFADKKDLVMEELGYFDINFAMESTSCDYFRKQANLTPDHTCQVLESSHGLREIRANYLKKNQSRKPKGKRVIFYVPVKLAYGLMKFNSLIYPMTWYFEHQKQLLRFFGARKDFHFVYKHSEHQIWAEESILPWLRNQKFENITVESKVFCKYLDQADGIILDGPTTVLFESSAAGLPVINLYHETIKPWPAMAQVFGKCLSSFKNFEEAAAKVDLFLKSNPDDYKVHLPMSEIDGIEYLKRVKSNKLDISVRNVEISPSIPVRL